ncbi:MAG: agmatinase [Candidatus Nezhaarchaeota archaeon]|nr:agmatinase [Candidatus Nezhaarchaeota archaeon]MCX8141490.1 agmatinase [Candidatus Nezhaarchaeota archaeon]MDW8049756.1 agmatinase [Nitrososphaerota archaeon]
MESLELYTVKTPYRFFELERDSSKAQLVLLGFPYDSTSCYRVGSRYAPLHIRIQSSAMEGYSWELGVEISEMSIADAGDLLVVHGNTKETLKRLTEVVTELVLSGKRVGVIGGEHTLTIGSIRGCSPKSLIVFDAHLDLKDEYPYGQKLSHATWLRRCLEEAKLEIVVIGVRATSKEEIKEARKLDLSLITFNQCKEVGSNIVTDRFSDLPEPMYVSVDVDVLDPAYAPGVSNPEPLGFTLHELLKYLWLLRGKAIIGFDVTEVCPPHDNGAACISACKILMDLALLSLMSAKL